MVKCEICNVNEAEVIAAMPASRPDFRFECIGCQSDSFYWISMEQFRAKANWWIEHLSQKSWFNEDQFRAKLKEAGIRPTDDRREYYCNCSTMELSYKQTTER